MIFYSVFRQPPGCGWLLWRERYRVVEAGGVAKWGGGSCIYWSPGDWRNTE